MWSEHYRPPRLGEVLTPSVVFLREGALSVRRGRPSGRPYCFYNGLRLTLLGPFLFPSVVSERSQAYAANRLMIFGRGMKVGNLTMRAFFTIAIVVTMAAVGLGGCFWHHQQAVETQPFK
jgi:hypothetical protein